MILPFRMAKCEPVPIVTEVSEKALGDRSGPAPAVGFFGPGFFQPIGQKGSRSLGAASKVDFFFNSIAGTSSPARAAESSRLVRQKARRSGFISLGTQFALRVRPVGTGARPGWREP